MIHDPQHSISEIRVTAPQGLHLRFADGEVFAVALSSVIRTHRALAALSDPALFANAHLFAAATWCGCRMIWRSPPITCAISPSSRPAASATSACSTGSRSTG